MNSGGTQHDTNTKTGGNAACHCTISQLMADLNRREKRTTRLLVAAVRFAAVVVILAMIVKGAEPRGATAQDIRWAPAQQIPGYAVDTRPPYMVADRTGAVHAFASQRVQGATAVIYRQWTLERGWTRPVDVLLPPEGGQAKIEGAYLDGNGTVHLAFYSGNEQRANIYYAKARSSVYGNAREWSTPKLVGKSAGPLSDAAVAGDGRGNLFILFSGKLAGYGLYAVQSHDSGATWSEPGIVFLTHTFDNVVGSIDAYSDSMGRIHAVWTVFDRQGNGKSILYARQEADHAAWSEPVVLATRTAYEASDAAMTENDKDLLVIYHEGSPPTRWMRRSSDGGYSWSDPIRPFPKYSGAYQAPALIRDSSNRLHLITGGRTTPLGGEETRGMWHSIWEGDRWSDLNAIVSGPFVGPTQSGVEFDPTGPRAVISQGNVLLATWATDGMAGINGVWFSYAILDAPRLPTIVPPTPFPSSTREPSTIRTASKPSPSAQLMSPTPTTLPVGQDSGEAAGLPIDAASDGQASWWIASTVPVVLLVSVVFAIQVARRS